MIVFLKEASVDNVPDKLSGCQVTKNVVEVA